MENSHNPRPLSALLQDMQSRFHGRDVQISEILEAFHERGFGLFLLIMGLFCIIPIPTFGLKSLVCIPMMLLAMQQALGFHTLWMPKIIKNKVIHADMFGKIMEHSLHWTQKIEKIAQPRLSMMTQGAFSHLIGLMGMIMTACVAMPLPLTNTVPAFGIVLMAVGVLMRDGLAVILGMIVGTVWSLAWFAAFFYLGAAGITMLLEQVSGIFS